VDCSPPRGASPSMGWGPRLSDVLVSRKGHSASPSDLSAVGSADPMPMHGMLQIRNTTYEVCSELPQLRRTVSDSELVYKLATSAASPDGAPEACQNRFRRDILVGETDDGIQSFDRIVAAMTDACRLNVLTLMIDHHQELQLDLGNFWSKGSELHTSGRCIPCVLLGSKNGCPNGRDCAHCHIPHPGKNNARPNATKREHMSKFCRLMRGITKNDGRELLQVRVRKLASENRRFKELLQENADLIFATSMSGASGARSSQSPVQSSSQCPASSPQTPASRSVPGFIATQEVQSQQPASSACLGLAFQ